MALNSAFGEKCAPADKDGNLQAICIADGCKLSDKAVCDKYGKAEAPAMCSMASGTMSGTMAPTGTMTGGMPSGSNMPSGTMMPSGTTTAPAQNTNGAAAAGVNVAAAAAGIAALLL